jgi:hypothetical protein
MKQKENLDIKSKEMEKQKSKIFSKFSKSLLLTEFFYKVFCIFR